MHTLYITLRFLPLALSFRRDFRRWIFWGGPVARTRAFHRARAERLVATITALGPTFVKLAQVFASRADLVPEPYVGALGMLLDRVPTPPFAAVAAEIVAAYGEPHTTLFESFDETALAAGSLGLVFRARWRGKDVAVKVLRPGIERVVARDLASARKIVAVVERWWPNPHVRGFRMTVEEFGRRIGDEMDFRLETEHAIEIGASFEGDRRVIVPHAYPEMARTRVMVMDFVEGERVDRISNLIADGTVDPRELVRGVMEIYVRMMLMDGLFHADPHPGNLLVAPDGRIVLLDFGMCVRVSVEQRATLVRTVMAAIRKDAVGVAGGFEALGIVDVEADPAEIVRLVEVLLHLAYSEVDAREKARVVAEEVMRELYDWPIVLTGEMVYFARAAALIEGLGARYVPDFNPITFASPIVVRMRHHIFATLQMDGGRLPPSWPEALGALASQATRIVGDAGRELAAVLGSGLAELLARTPLAGPGSGQVDGDRAARRPSTPRVAATLMDSVDSTMEDALGAAIGTAQAVGGSLARALDRLLQPPPAPRQVRPLLLPAPGSDGHDTPVGRSGTVPAPGAGRQVPVARSERQPPHSLRNQQDDPYREEDVEEAVVDTEAEEAYHPDGERQETDGAEQADTLRVHLSLP